MQENTNKPDPKVSEDKTEQETKESIANGRSAIKVESKVGDKSKEETSNDATDWRNEG